MFGIGKLELCDAAMARSWVVIFWGSWIRYRVMKMTMVDNLNVPEIWWYVCNLGG
jgi:hypothetical protein